MQEELCEVPPDTSDHTADEIAKERLEWQLRVENRVSYKNMFSKNAFILIENHPLHIMVRLCQTVFTYHVVIPLQVTPQSLKTVIIDSIIFY